MSCRSALSLGVNDVAVIGGFTATQNRLKCRLEATLCIIALNELMTLSVFGLRYECGVERAGLRWGGA